MTNIAIGDGLTRMISSNAYKFNEALANALQSTGGVYSPNIAHQQLGEGTYFEFYNLKNLNTLLFQNYRITNVSVEPIGAQLDFDLTFFNTALEADVKGKFQSSLMDTTFTGTVKWNDVNVQGQADLTITLIGSNLTITGIKMGTMKVPFPQGVVDVDLPATMGSESTNQIKSAMQEASETALGTFYQKDYGEFFNQAMLRIVPLTGYIS
jgi:hypothetical protein